MSMLFSNNEVVNQTIRDYLNSQLKDYGDIKYSYLILNKKNPSEINIISNYPNEWVNIYRENNYQHIDPVVIVSFNKISPFSWDESISINSKLKLSKIFNQSKKYNVINGYTFVLHDPEHNLAMFSIMLDERENDDMNYCIYKNKEKLQMLLINAHEKTISLYKETANDKNENIFNNKEIFSKRENEILYWASMGKTYHEISIILGIKTGTVKFHVGNAVKKLGVLNAKHAIRLSIELQLIKPVNH